MKVVRRRYQRDLYSVAERREAVCLKIALQS